MRTPQELDRLREQAVALRCQGKSLRQIKAILGPMSNTTLNDALKDEPPPEWTRRPRAKDELRARARELRGQGMNYEEIATALGAAKSSVSLWVRDLPVPARLSYTECRKRSAEGTLRYWAIERPIREAQREAARAAAAAEIGNVTERELLIAGAIAYWCEGTKNKPHRRTYQVSFMNTDPALIRFFLRFLDATGTPRSDLCFRVCIHENADAEAAQRFWLEVTGALPDQFRTPTLKRHNPRTVRKNVDENYHGCLRIDVRRSSGLFRNIEGWAEAAMMVAEPSIATSNLPTAPGEGFEPSLTGPKPAVLPG